MPTAVAPGAREAEYIEHRRAPNVGNVRPENLILYVMPQAEHRPSETPPQNVDWYRAQPWHTDGGALSPIRRRRKSWYAGPCQIWGNGCPFRSPRVTRSSPITMQHGWTTPALVTYA